MPNDHRQEEGPWGYIADSGITERHFRFFQEAAYELSLEIVVRNTNMKSTYWIERGYPPKPKALEFLHTDEGTGRVTATNEAESTRAREIGFWVVDQDGKARDKHGKEQTVDTLPRETLAEGEVVDPKTRRVIVGDYDLMGAFPPDPEKRRRNLILLPPPGEHNYTNRTIRDVMGYINAKLVADGDVPRVLHGSDEHYVEKPSRRFKGGATVFYPKGTDRYLDTGRDVEWYYRSIKRKALWEDPY